MIVTVAIGAFGQVFKAVIVESSQERAVSAVSKVLGAYLLFKGGWLVHLKRSTVGHPRNHGLIGRLRQDGVNLLRKGHVVHVGWTLCIQGRRGYLGVVPIGMIHDPATCRGGANVNRLDGKVVALTLRLTPIAVAAPPACHDSCYDAVDW